MKIELKKVQIFEAMSEETTAFKAEIYVNGKNVGYAKNDGHGGSTDCRPYNEKPELKELFKQAEQHCLSLPPIKFDAAHGGKAFEIKMDLENFVDELIEAEQKKKDAKKLEKKMEKAILISNVDEFGSIAQISYAGVTLKQVPLEKLQATYDKYKASLKPNQKILNTNLAALGVKL